MPPPILITGATGTVGSLLVRQLEDAGVRPRAFVRDVGKARALLGGAAELVVGDLAQPEVVRDALTGVDTLFLACGNVPDQAALECGAVDAARAAGVRRVVKLSARGAAPDASPAAWRAHATIEQHLRASGLAAVILRPSFYMTNLLAAAAPVRALDVLPAAAGAASIAMIDPADVAAVAARILTDDTVADGVLHLDGPEALTYSEVAERLSALLGRDITYLDVAPEAAAEAMMADGLPAPGVRQVLEIFAELRSGAYATADCVLPRLIGRPGVTLTGFLDHHLAAFGHLGNH